MTDHPITPPYELVQQWATSSPIQYSDESWAYELFIAHQAARWGADQELEACCEWLPSDLEIDGQTLREHRRPKPPSLMTDFHPAPFDDFSTELRDPWPVVERLRMALREAERYCLGAENITGHCITDLLDRLPNEDD